MPQINNSHWEIVTDHSCLLGEGPVWDAAHKRLFWVDILLGHLHYYYPADKKCGIFPTGQFLGAVAPASSGCLIAALQSGFFEIDLEQEDIRLIREVEKNLEDNRFNDGKCDPAGRFWAGTVSLSGVSGAGTLYRLEKDNSVSVKVEKVSCSNGLAWSRDQKTFYYIDTPTQQVVAYNYDIDSGSISDKRTVVVIPKEDGYPDGMTIDEEGMLWIALWNGWKVVRYDPLTGKRISEISLPVSQVSSCAFGGEHLDDLFITSAKTGLGKDALLEQPHAGKLFVIRRSGYKGMPAYEVKS